jgi:glycosyltransferase involved in cell wall biosynthesis
VKFFDCTAFVNYYESLEWGRFGKCLWIPNGVSQSLIESQYPYRRHGFPSIAFFGKMDYQPNVDALKWFYGNVMDKLDPRIVVLVIGSNQNKLAQWFESKTNRIQFTGYLEDPYAQLANCECIIAPMQTGGGIQNKILESMGIGQIVITTSLAGSPIVGAVHGTHFFIEDYPQGMANRINEIVANRLSYEEVGCNAKELISKAYTWHNYEEKLLGCMVGEVQHFVNEDSHPETRSNQSVVSYQVPNQS